MRQLSAFPAGFTLDAASAAARETGLDAVSVMEGIASLVAKSLVSVERLGTGARWFMLETIREYALDKHADTNAAAGHRAA